MEAASRQVLVVGTTQDQELLGQLKRAGWQPMPVADARYVNSLKGARQCACCLILADSRLDKQLPRLAGALSALELEALLVLDRGELAKPAVRQFVDEYCHDFHHRPVDAEHLLKTLGHLHGKALLRRRERQDEPHVGELIGAHPSMQQLRRDIRKVARSHANILVSGESGTGKELVARTVHQLSQRAGGPFQAVNCGALPGALVQSELFGHEKGAFTGAHERRIGRIEAANGGTLFLDEIGDMPLEAQVNLLRFLQERTIDRLGNSHAVEVDVRVIAATHIDLAQAAASGHFREDLFYRLNVCTLRLPPLRERVPDILPIAHYLIERSAVQLGVPKRRLSSEAAQALLHHGWPGNVRELANRISQGLVMASGRAIKPADMGLAAQRSQPQLMTLDAFRERAEKEALQTVIALNHGNSSQAARVLGVSRATLYRLLQKYRLGDPHELE
jgi:DNA-binding NtrC family response regulator